MPITVELKLPYLITLSWITVSDDVKHTEQFIVMASNRDAVSEWIEQLDSKFHNLRYDEDRDGRYTNDNVSYDIADTIEIE
jgi:hypothetical protein